MFVLKSTLRACHHPVVRSSVSVPVAVLLATLAGVLLLAPPTISAQVTVESALRFVPVQKDVAYDRPAGNEIEKCTVKAEEISGVPAWVVRGPAGQILRSFNDTNEDNRVDQWCYYENGFESYRDLDTNFNGNADQFRWLGLSGMKWGIDQNEDGNIDQWKEISPEEVSAEIVAAVRDNDPQRFSTVLLTRAELAKLGLNETTTKKMAERLGTAVRRFQSAAASQKLVAPGATWIHFSASRPAAIPAGANGSTRDVHVYENVAAMLDNGQLPIGTLVRADGQWRAIDIPVGLMAEKERVEFGGFLLTPAITNPMTVADDGGLDEATLKLVAEMSKLDEAIQGETNRAKRDVLYDRQVAILRQLANGQSDQQNWIRQLAETLGTAIQTGEYSRAKQELTKLHKELEAQPGGDLLAAYAGYRLLNAQYTERLRGEDVKYEEVQKWWVDSLEAFVKKNPKGPDYTEAMMQLAIAEEAGGNTRIAEKHYETVIASGEGELEIAKAKGSLLRLTSVGKPLRYGGTSVVDRAKKVNVGDYQGKFVLIHFWATWNDASVTDMKLLKRLKAGFGKDLEVIGVNLDVDQNALAAFFKENPPLWEHIYEPGGLDSKPATDLGILNLPLNILLDRKGEVVDRNISLEAAQKYINQRL